MNWDQNERHVLRAAGLLHGRRKQVPDSTTPPAQHHKKKNSWATRVLAEPRLELAVGVLVGLPSAIYLDALRRLVAGKYSTATPVIAVIVFVLIEFLLIIIPFAFLELRPEGTRVVIKRTQDWLLGHALRLMAGE